MADNNHDDLLLYGALAIGVFIVGKSLLSAFGVSPEDTATVRDQTQMLPAENPLSSQFQPEIDHYNSNAPRDANGNIIPREKNYQALRASYFDPNSIVFTDPSYAEEQKIARLSEAIYDEISAFHLVTDPAPILAAFSEVQTQREASEIAEYFYANFNIDLLTYLKGSLFKSGLNDTDLATVINHINNLPE